MTFTRSLSGLANYSNFFNSELLVYAEGKSDTGNSYDSTYYNILIKKLTDCKKIKIKLVGNKKSAMDYFEKIKELENDKSIVIVDKDLIGISSSLIKHKKLFITHGYSWENDFWTSGLCKDVISLITIGNANAKTRVEKSFRSTQKWIGKISALDAACQANGTALFPKNGGSCGINLTNKIGCNLISAQEFKRFKTKYYSTHTTNCPVSNEIIKVAMRQPPYTVVQGHLWEHIAIKIIEREYKNVTKSKTVQIDMIKNIAFSKFSEDPLKYITPDCLKHFEDQFSRLSSVDISLKRK